MRTIAGSNAQPLSASAVEALSCPACLDVQIPYTNEHVAVTSMKTIRSLREKLSGIGFARQWNRKQKRILIVHDPELVAMVRIADQRRHRENDDMERILGRVRHILDRRAQTPLPTPRLELTPQLKAKVTAIPDAEERIRAIVDYTLCSKAKTETHD